ncbi:MAG: hypothetical protein ACOX58_03605 [Christensenellales bacterium]|jgi:hypothetical protein
MMKRSFNALIWLMVFSLLIPLALAESTATPAPESTTALPVPAIATLAPQEGDLTEAEALPIARELLETLGIDARLLENATFAVRAGFGQEAARVAVVTLTSSVSASIFTVTMDAQSGVVLSANEFDANCLTTLLYENNTSWVPQPMAEEQPEEEFPYPAFLNNPDGAAVNLTQMPTDYHIPMGAYMNGTPAIVTGIQTLDSNNLMDMQGGAQATWAQVTIGLQGNFAGIAGFVPAHMISRDLAATALDSLPRAELTTKNPTQHLSLYKAGNKSSDILGVYRDGTGVQVMGRLRDWYHVRLGSLTGFVEVSCLRFDKSTQALLDKTLPETFDSVQPGVEERYQKYMTAVDELWFKFGDSNDWPLSIKALYSQLSLDWGFADGAINLMPGEKDLTQIEAEALAQAAIEKEYGMTVRDYAKVSVRFAAPADDLDKPEWTFRFQSIASEMPDCAVTLDRAGKVLSFWQDNSAAKPGAYDPLSDLYLYQFGGQETEETPADLARPRAEEIAMRVYAEQTGENLDTVMTTGVLMANDTIRWWYVTMTQPESTSAISFDVVVLSPEGTVAAYTAREQYLAEAPLPLELQELEALEREKGSLYTWSLEDKQQYAPDFWGLPGEEDITQDEALAIATKCLVDQFGIKEEELPQWQPYYRFDISGNPLWIVEFFTEEIINSDTLTGYTIVMDAKSGEILEAWSPEQQNG